MQFETSDDPLAQDDKTGPDTATTTPYETERQARAGVAGVYLWMYGYEDSATWRAVRQVLPTAGPHAVSTSKAVP